MKILMHLISTQMTKSNYAGLLEPQLRKKIARPDLHCVRATQPGPTE